MLFRSLDASKITSGTLPDARLAGISASKVSGVLADGNIPELAAGQITSGEFALARIPTLTADKVPALDASKIATGELPDDRLAGISASKVSGELAVDNIPALTAAKIPGEVNKLSILSNAGALSLKGTDHSYIQYFEGDTRVGWVGYGNDVATTFTLNNTLGGFAFEGGNVTAPGYIGDGSGLTGFTATQIPALDASKITTGQVPDARLAGISASKVNGVLVDGNIPDLEIGRAHV